MPLLPSMVQGPEPTGIVTTRTPPYPSPPCYEGEGGQRASGSLVRCFGEGRNTRKSRRIPGRSRHAALEPEVVEMPARYLLVLGLIVAVAVECVHARVIQHVTERNGDFTRGNTCVWKIHTTIGLPVEEQVSTLGREVRLETRLPIDANALTQLRVGRYADQVAVRIEVMSQIRTRTLIVHVPHFVVADFEFVEG